MAEFENLYWEIMNTNNPRYIFGKLGGSPEEQLRALEDIHREMAEKINPGNFTDNLDDQAIAKEALDKLTELFHQAQASIALKIPIVSPEGQSYQITGNLGSSKRFNLYQCELPDGGLGVLKIAATRESNSNMDREALVLQTLTDQALATEALNKSAMPLNFQNFIPNLVETFTSASQKNRRVSILTFPSVVKELSQLTPLSSLIRKERIRVDPRTSAWILGKVLKVLSFAYEHSVSCGLVSLGNIMIERNKHGVVVFDWTQAFIHPIGNVSADVQGKEISQAARVAIAVMGGDLENGNLPESDQLTDNRYEKFIWDLAQGKTDSATVAHHQFYDLIWSLWPRGFHPFTSFPLT